MPNVSKNPAQNLDPTKPWYSFQAAAGESRKAKVMIYDAIGGWFGIQTSDFVRELNALDVDEIELHLNSPGGSAFDGIAIHNALRQHQAKVTVIVDGLAASAASAVAMGGDEIVMAHGSMMMIHDASAIAWGSAATCRKTADVLDKLSDNYAAVYARKAGGTAAQWRDAMLAESWYGADEAVEAGLADRTDSEAEADAEAMASHMASIKAMAIFNFAGRAEAPDPSAQNLPDWEIEMLGGVPALNTTTATAVAPQTPVSSEPGNTNRKEGTQMDEFLADLRTRLGLNAEASQEDILAKLDGLTAEHGTEAATTPPGTVLVEQGVFDAMQADATAGREARELQIAQGRDGIIATALREGRITKASAEAFRKQLDADEKGTAAILATLAPNTVVPVDEVGNGGGDAEASEDAEYNRYFPKEA